MSQEVKVVVVGLPPVSWPVLRLRALQNTPKYSTNRETVNPSIESNLVKKTSASSPAKAVNHFRLSKVHVNSFQTEEKQGELGGTDISFVRNLLERRWGSLNLNGHGDK